MKNTRASLLVYLLLLALLSAGLPPQTFAQRERRTETQPQVPAAQPSPSPSPVASPTTTVPEPSPSPAPAIKVTPATTLPELQTKIREILAKPELAPATVGVKVVSLDTGRILFEENAAKLLRP